MAPLLACFAGRPRIPGGDEYVAFRGGGPTGSRMRRKSPGSSNNAVRVTYLRGTYRQKAAPGGQGAMGAVMGLEQAALQAMCERASSPGEPVELANLNGAGQIVISGHTAAVDRAVADARAAGARR